MANTFEKGLPDRLSTDADGVQLHRDIEFRNSRRKVVFAPVATCWRCGRPMSATHFANAWFVQVIDHGASLRAVDTAVEPSDDHPGWDEGWSPIGSECAKYIPARFRARIAEQLHRPPLESAWRLTAPDAQLRSNEPDRS